MTPAHEKATEDLLAASEDAYVIFSGSRQRDDGTFLHYFEVSANLRKAIEAYRAARTKA